MKAKPPVFCVGCGNRIPGRCDRLTRYCKACFLKRRCPKCGQVMSQAGLHKCASVEEKGPRHCIQCDALLRDKGWERYAKVCGKCYKAKIREIDKQLRAEMRAAFGGCCCRCGYDRCIAALHFHHKDSSEKRLWNTTRVTGGRGSTSVREVRAHPERFELVCANCHFEIHSEEREGKVNANPITDSGATVCP
jgi:hypothetical protein